MFAGLNPAMIIASAGWIWLARTLVMQQLVAEAAAFAENKVAHTIPVSAELAFTALMLTLVIGTLAACWALFTRKSPQTYREQGITAALWLLGFCTLFDLLFQTVFGSRDLTDYVLRIWLDFLPVVLIPIGCGLVLDHLNAANTETKKADLTVE